MWINHNQKLLEDKILKNQNISFRLANFQKEAIRADYFMPNESKDLDGIQFAFSSYQKFL